MDCQNIVGTSAYDLYKLSNDPSPPAPPPLSPAPPSPPSAGHVLVQEQKECDDDGESVAGVGDGYLATLQECADACAATTGCVNFIYGRIGAGRCSGSTCKCYTVRATAPLPPPSFSRIPLEPCGLRQPYGALLTPMLYGVVANANCA